MTHPDGKPNKNWTHPQIIEYVKKHNLNKAPVPVSRQTRDEMITNLKKVGHWEDVDKIAKTRDRKKVSGSVRDRIEKRQMGKGGGATGNEEETKEEKDKRLAKQRAKQSQDRKIAEDKKKAEREKRRKAYKIDPKKQPKQTPSKITMTRKPPMANKKIKPKPKPKPKPPTNNPPSASMLNMIQNGWRFRTLSEEDDSYNDLGMTLSAGEADFLNPDEEQFEIEVPAGNGRYADYIISKKNSLISYVPYNFAVKEGEQWHKQMLGGIDGDESESVGFFNQSGEMMWASNEEQWEEWWDSDSDNYDETVEDQKYTWNKKNGKYYFTEPFM
mgnify:CR=1 FL=1|tara:strand:- start:2655 stop:3638 length:984 start_codon:yes stop_codon:yes gene_type:complete